MTLRLFTYWRSTAAYRVRIALNLKALSFESVPRHLVRDGGEQRRSDYLAVNPLGLVPTLEVDGFAIPQSLAICEYLDEMQSRPPLLPGSAHDRAIVRGMALAIACDTHPLNNLPVTGYLRREFGADDAAVQRWIAHWITRGFTGLECWIGSLDPVSAPGTRRFCFGAQVTLADVCLVPQMYGARRFGVDLDAFPALVAICDHLEALPAFAAARPEAQPDAE